MLAESYLEFFPGNLLRQIERHDAFLVWQFLHCPLLSYLPWLSAIYGIFNAKRIFGRVCLLASLPEFLVTKNQERTFHLACLGCIYWTAYDTWRVRLECACARRQSHWGVMPYLGCHQPFCVWLVAIFLVYRPIVSPQRTLLKILEKWERIVLRNGYFVSIRTWREHLFPLLVGIYSFDRELAIACINIFQGYFHLVFQIAQTYRFLSIAIHIVPFQRQRLIVCLVLLPRKLYLL